MFSLHGHGSEITGSIIRGYRSECGPFFKLKGIHTDIISKYVHVYYHILEHSEHNNLTTTV